MHTPPPSITIPQSKPGAPPAGAGKPPAGAGEAAEPIGPDGVGLDGSVGRPSTHAMSDSTPSAAPKSKAARVIVAPFLPIIVSMSRWCSHVNAGFAVAVAFPALDLWVFGIGMARHAGRRERSGPRVQHRPVGVPPGAATPSRAYSAGRAERTGVAIDPTADVPGDGRPQRAELYVDHVQRKMTEPFRAPTQLFGLTTRRRRYRAV
jgi:hypothetical protein